MSFAGLILCGGQSKRMGRPKAWLPFGDELMLPLVVRILQGVLPRVLVVAAPDQEVPPLPPGVEVLRDDTPHQGPLAGLRTGLRALQGTDCEGAYLSACDAPFLRPAFVRLLLESLGEASICVPHTGGYHHPLAAAYRLGVLPEVERLLAESRPRPVYLFDAVPTRILTGEQLRPADPELDSLANLNTPEDYAAALQRLRAGR